jgi:hypothetical protein
VVRAHPTVPRHLDCPAEAPHCTLVSLCELSTKFPAYAALEREWWIDEAQARD